MKPDFALSLSSEGISFLQRSGSDWDLLGQVYLTEADFIDRLVNLRTSAMERSRNANQVKLVIPNDQIKYFSLSRPKDAHPGDIEKMIQLSLDAETPYNLEEICFDWVSDADTIYVAAVARQTLHEAEEFATRQGFQPLGNVAAAPEGHFIGEVFFGLTDGAASRMECDAKPIRVNSSAINALNVAGQSAEEHIEEFEEERDTSEIASLVFKSVRERSVKSSSDNSRKNAPPVETLVASLPDKSEGTRQDGAMYYEKTTFFERFIWKILPVLLHLRQKQKSGNKFTREGYFPTVIIASFIFALIGGLGFYLTKSEKLSATDDVRISDRAPQTQTEAQLLSKDLDFGDFARIPKPSPLTLPFVSQREDAEGRQIRRLILADEQYTTKDADLIRPTWGAEPKFASKKDTGAESKSFAISKLQMTPIKSLQLSKAPAKISKPTAPSGFQFLTERLRGIYANHGVWSFSPLIPLVQAPIPVRDPVVGRWEPLAQQRLNTQLTNYEIFETALLVEQEVLEKKTVIAGLDAPVLTTKKEDSLSEEMTEALALQPKIASLSTPDQLSGSATQPIRLNPPFIDKVHITSRSFDELLNPRALISQNPQIGVPQNTEILPSTPIAQIDTENQRNKKTGATTIGLAALTLPDLSVNQPPPQMASLTPARPGWLPPQEQTTPPFIDIHPSKMPEAAEENLNANVLRPKPRPETVKPIEPEMFTGAVAQSLRPKARPKIKKPAEKTVEVASVLAILPEEEGEEASTGGKSAKTTNSTISGKKATIKRALNLSEVNLLGVYYFSGKRSALVRLKNGKRLMVKVGDRLDGGKVAAIGKRELRYVKSGENITLDLPG